MMPDLPALLAAINVAQGTSYTSMERYAGGEQGAYRLRDSDGREAVLKWSVGRAHADRVQRATAVTERLRQRAYPAPRYGAVGVVEDVSYSVQEALPGQPLASLPPELVPAVIALNARQAGAAGGLPRQWPAPVRDPLLRGGDGFCLHDTLRSHSAEAARLLDRLRRIAEDVPAGS